MFGIPPTTGANGFQPTAAFRSTVLAPAGIAASAFNAHATLAPALQVTGLNGMGSLHWSHHRLIPVVHQATSRGMRISWGVIPPVAAHQMPFAQVVGKNHLVPRGQQRLGNLRVRDGGFLRLAP